MFAALASMLTFGALAAVITDATVAGVFTLLNTALLFWLNRRQQQTHQKVERVQRVLAAPRRLVYDSEGRPFGTVLALQDEDDFAPGPVYPGNTVAGVGRRQDDRGTSE